MSQPPIRLWYDVFKGYNAQHTDTLEQSREGLELVTAQNVIPDPLGDIATRDGFSHVRATAIAGAGSITGMSHGLRDASDKFVLTDSDGDTFIDDANPPVKLAGGTDYTDGVDNLTRFDTHESLLIGVSRLRDLPQTVNTSGVRADLGGTPPYGLDYKVFGRRGHMFSPLYGGTTYLERIMFNSANDDHDVWADPTTINFLNFGRPGSGVQVVGGEVYADHLMTFTSDAVFPVYTTPNATIPFSFQKEIFREAGGGPVGAHAVVATAEGLYWISNNFDVKQQVGLQVNSIGRAVQPFLRGLNDARRQFISGGFEPKNRMVVWNVSDGADTVHKTQLCLQIDTGWFYIQTIQCNALANRMVSGELQLIGGHNNGLFSTLYDGSTTGDLQTAVSLIDADIITPRLHLGMPGIVKKVPYLCVEFDPIATEVVTVQYRLDDATAWTSFSESTTTMSGTDIQTAWYPIPGPFERIALRFRDANSGERKRELRIGFPQPRATRAVMN